MKWQGKSLQAYDVIKCRYLLLWPTWEELLRQILTIGIVRRICIKFLYFDQAFCVDRNQHVVSIKTNFITAIPRKNIVTVAWNRGHVRSFSVSFIASASYCIAFISLSKLVTFNASYGFYKAVYKWLWACCYLPASQTARSCRNLSTISSGYCRPY